MSKSFFTGSEIELYNGSQNFAQKIVLAPTMYGLTQQTADMYVERGAQNAHAGAWELPTPGTIK